MSLGLSDVVPAWLVILIVSRDVLIIGGVLLAWVIEKPVGLKPLALSKVNTAGQIILAGCILAALGFNLVGEGFLAVGYYLVAALTIVSGALYLREWARQMANGRPKLREGSMTFQRQLLFWIGAFVLLVLGLWLLSDILLPFIAGLVLAYFLDPVADALERLRLAAAGRDACSFSA